jgi:chemotaxis protein MotB
MKKRGHSEEHENLERWLLTYADLITLLLAFFIMLYSLSKNDAQRYHEIASYLKAIFSGGTGILEGGALQGGGAIEIPDLVARKEEIAKRLYEQISEAISGTEVERTFSVTPDERGITIRVLDRTFFDEGKADLKERAKKILDSVAPTLLGLKNHIRIEGHTDNVPINTSEFRSNWELSVRRATEVIRYLIERHKLPPERLSASGYSEFRPIAPNDTPEGRALNRRIEIIILQGESG